MILEGYCTKSPKPRAVAEQEAKAFLKIIEDSSNYQFGYNHSTGYSMIGYLCAYLRHYYPLEFVTAYLNNADNESDMLEGTKLANQLNIKIFKPKFGYSAGKYHPDKTNNAVYKGIGSIKFCNENVGKELLSMSKVKEYEDFLDLIIDINENTGCTSRQIEILIKLGFFSQFGKTQYLLNTYEKFKARYKKTHKDKTKLVRIQEIREFMSTLENVELPVNDIIKAELEFVGYVTYTDPEVNSTVMLISKVKTNKYGTVFLTMYRLKDGATTDVKVDKSFFMEHVLKEMDVIYIIDVKSKFKRRPVEGKWVVTDEKEMVLTRYAKVKM